MQTSFLCCFQVNDQKGGCCVSHLVFTFDILPIENIFAPFFSTFFIFNFKLKKIILHFVACEILAQTLSLCCFEIND